MLITSCHTDKYWAGLRARIAAGEESAFLEAISIFQRRIEERFFRCIDHLLLNDEELSDKWGDRDAQLTVPGFAVMSLCSLLIETLHAFYIGHVMQPWQQPVGPCGYPHGACIKTPSTSRSLSNFLRDSPHFSDFNSRMRSSFSQNIRNALLHDAETRSGWVVRMNEPSDKIVEKQGDEFVLNRTKFYAALRAEFADYLKRLPDPQQGDLRKNFMKKMDAICQYVRPSEPQQPATLA